MPAPLPIAPGEYDPEAVKAQARAWVDGVNSAAGVSGGWRLQVLRLRTRRKFDGGSPGTATDVNGDAVSSVGAHAPDGGCDELPARLRRFVPGCPWALVDQAVRYLYEIAPYTGIVYNGVKVEGKYRPTLTQWVRDDQTNVGERGANGTYTLIQDLIEVTDCDDSLGVATGASCSAYEETTFKWDADSVESLPVECEQGVTWSIRAVSRDDEDGTYSYQLVKTTARTRHYGPALVECGPQAEVTEESWESAYGEPGRFEARGCDVSGPIETPPCDTEPGVRTQVQYRENPDCTFDVVVRRRTSKEFSDSWRDGTACRPQDVTVVRNAKAAPPAPVPAVGERVDRKLQRNEDNTYDFTDTVVRAPDPYSYSWTDGSACRQRSVEVLRAQKAMPAVPAVRAGETLDADVQRNEDCTWDARFAVTKAPDAFVHSWTEGSACRPVDVRVAQNEAGIPVPPAPGPGETVSMTLSRNADCTYDSRIQLAKPAPESMLSWTQGSTCRPEVVTSWRRAATAPSVPAPGAGEVVRASVSMNDDCTFDGQVTVVKPPPKTTLSWSDGSPCRPAEHKAWQGWTEVPAVEARAQGRTVSASLRRNDDCTYDGTQEVVEAVPSQVSWSEGSPCRPVAARAAWGQRAVDVTAPSQGRTVSASVSRNADCTYDVTEKVATSPSPSTAAWTDGSCAQPTEHVLHENALSVPSPGAGGVGVVKRASFRRNDDCTYSGEVATTTSSPESASWTEGVSCRPTAASAFWNQRSVAIPAIPAGGTVSASVSRNADCTYDYVTKVTPAMSSAGGSWDGGSQCEAVHTTAYFHYGSIPPVPRGGRGTYTRANFRMNEDCTYSGDVEVATSAPDSQSWTDGGACAPADHHVFFNQDSVDIPPPSPGQTVSASVSKNRDCTYNYQYAVRTAEERVDEQEWESEEEGPTYKYTYENKLILFSHMKSVPRVPHHSSVGVSVQLNDDCTYSGSITSRRLKNWAQASHGGDGGIGTSTFTRTIKAIVNGVTKTRTMRYQTTVYKGAGNASASTLAHHQSVSGVAGAIVAVDLIDEGNWQ